MTDLINSPPHYCDLGAVCSNCAHPIECIDVTANMGFVLGNVVKYLWRFPSKNGVEDLKKAQWYLNYFIKQFEEDRA